MECGLELGPSKLRQAVSRLSSRGAGFFRWHAVSVVLIVLTVMYGIASPLNIYLAGVSAKRGDQLISHALYVGAFWNGVVAILCICGRQLLKHQTRQYFAGGAATVAMALSIVMRTWMGSLLRGLNPFPVFEVILIWLPLAYVLVYAFRGLHHADGA